MNDSRLREALERIARKATQRGWKVSQDGECKEIIKQAEAALAEPASAECIGYPDCDGDLPGEPHSEKCTKSASDLRAKLEALRELSEKATAGEWDGLFTRRANDVEFAVACVNAVRAILDGKG